MAKKLAIVFGVVFVLVGAMGMIGTGIVGPMGLFETNSIHDIVHLLIGIVLLGVAFMSPASSGTWLKVFGVVYLAIAVLGFLLVPSGGELLGLVHTNAADHLLHIVLGIVLYVAGMMGGKGMQSAPMAQAPAPAPMPPSSDSSSMGGTM